MHRTNTHCKTLSERENERERGRETGTREKGAEIPALTGQVRLLRNMRAHNLVDEVVPIVKQLTLFFSLILCFCKMPNSVFFVFKLKEQKNCVTLLTRWGAAICTLCSIPFGSLNLNVKVCKKKKTKTQKNGQTTSSVGR